MRELQATARFRNRVANDIRCRPDYPYALIDHAVVTACCADDAQMREWFNNRCEGGTVRFDRDPASSSAT